MEIPIATEGFIPTLNSMGFMTTGLDPYSLAFVDFSADTDAPVLDIGAAYGIASKAALANGAMVIANDLDTRHLELLGNAVSADERARLTLLPGAFPESITLSENTLGAALACRILHFLDSQRLQEGIEKVYRWLKPGGKFFAVAETVYVRTFRNAIPLYESRVAQGDPWPGYFNNVHEIVPELKDKLPTSMHMLDTTVLKRVFEQAGFNVEKVETFARTDFPAWLRWDGRESVGIIGRK